MDSNYETPAATLRTAYEFARQGELARAERLCDEILQQRGNLPEVLLLRGAIEVQTGRTAQGAASVGRAIEGDPSRPAAHALLGDALLTLNRPREALDCYAAALRLAPQLASAQLGRGNALLEEGRPHEAMASFDAVLERLPHDAEAHFGRGAALFRLQRCEEAVTSFDHAIRVRPTYAAAFSNRGSALALLKRYAPALQSFDAAVAIDPAFAEAWYNRGCVLRELRQLEEALHALDRASGLRTHYVEAAVGRGHVLLDLRRPHEALAVFEQALQWRADDVEALHGRGNALRVLKHYSEAIDAYDAALRLDANNAPVHYNRGTAFAMWDCHLDEAVASYERALNLNPGFDYLTGTLCFARRIQADWSSESPAAPVERIVRAVLDGKRAVAPFHCLSFTDSAPVQWQCAVTYAADRCAARKPARPFTPYRHQRIRVAYVSPDFREHAVSYLMAGVFERHDAERFEIMAVSLRPAESTAFGQRVERAFHRFIDASAYSDDEVVELLRTLEVDIAVDLCGFTDGFRTQIFAQRAAPIQVNYLGLPGTMGAPFMDYLLADAFVIPPQAQQHYAERIVYMPDCFQANDDRRAVSETKFTREQAGLPGGGFVFCCFNNSYKINPQMFELWMRLLDRTPGAVLWLLRPNEPVRDNLRREALARGVEPQRLVFAERLPYAEHSSRLGLADLFLDTLPFNAGATASDALWAGLPLLTCAGEAYAARMAGSLLRAIGLPELVTHSLEEYEARAIELAAQPQELNALRRRLSDNRSRAPLFDTDRFRRHLESAYSQMWMRHERGDAPAAFTVDSTG